MSKKYKFAILDRDGVINVDHGHVGTFDKFDLFPDVIDFLKYIQIDYRIVIFTNQAGIAKGKYTLSNFFDLTSNMLREFEDNGIDIFHIFWCPHHTDATVPLYNIACNCRKPKTGMLRQLEIICPVDLTNSFVVGDKLTDLIAAKDFGIKNRFMITDHRNSSDIAHQIDTLSSLSKFLENKKE